MSAREMTARILLGESMRTHEGWAFCFYSRRRWRRQEARHATLESYRYCRIQTKYSCYHQIRCLRIQLLQLSHDCYGGGCTLYQHMCLVAGHAGCCLEEVVRIVVQRLFDDCCASAGVEGGCMSVQLLFMHDPQCYFDLAAKAFSTCTEYSSSSFMQNNTKLL